MGMKKRSKPIMRMTVTHHLSSSPGKDGCAPTGPRTFTCSANGANLRNPGTYDWDRVRCLDCLKKAPPEHQYHYDPSEPCIYSKAPYPCGAPFDVGFPASGQDVTCGACLEYIATLSVAEELEDSARIIVSNALIAANRDGRKIVQKGCHQCRSYLGGSDKDACITCAVVRYRDLDKTAMVESELTRIFAVPYEWIVDLIAGFDGDPGRPTYNSANRIGKRLWRRYGKRRIKA